MSKDKIAKEVYQELSSIKQACMAKGILFDLPTWIEVDGTRFYFLDCSKMPKIKFDADLLTK